MSLQSPLIVVDDWIHGITRPNPQYAKSQVQVTLRVAHAPRVRKLKYYCGTDEQLTQMLGPVSSGCKVIMLSSIFQEPFLEELATYPLLHPCYVVPRDGSQTLILPAMVVYWY